MAVSFFKIITEDSHKYFPKKPGEFLLRPYGNISEIFDGMLYTLYYPSSALKQSLGLVLLSPLTILLALCFSKLHKEIPFLKASILLMGAFLGGAVVFSVVSLASLAYHLLAFATRLISTVVKCGVNLKNEPDSDLYEQKLPSFTIFSKKSADLDSKPPESLVNPRPDSQNNEDLSNLVTPFTVKNFLSIFGAYQDSSIRPEHEEITASP